MDRCERRPTGWLVLAWGVGRVQFLPAHEV